MTVDKMDDFLFPGELSELDPETAELIAREAERQVRKLIMIPSESMAPQAVLQAEGSVFQNIYAEGYPPPRTRAQSVEEILDYEDALAYFRRTGSPRYYMGTEYVDMVEALARRRCAELFATSSTPAGHIWVNVQPLSGSPANLAVYKALLEPGDVLMGMDLLHGGHLSHGSPAHWSGQFYRRASYSVKADSERLDYDEIAALAAQHKPRVIVAGYTSYPYAPDWAAFRQIADSVGAYLLADISHVAGLVCAGVFPSPVGYAHVVSFTTHKTLCGPRGACILTTDERLGRRIDRAVFPGEQGGPHINAVAAMAVAFKLAASPRFAALQKQIVANARRLAQCLQEQGMRVAYGGTDSHMLVLDCKFDCKFDCKTVRAIDSTPLMGDPAVRILDLAGIVANRNTIPGDDCAARASGVRMGTPWVTQRGLCEPEMERLAEAIAKTLRTACPYPGGAKVDFDALEESKLIVQELVAKTDLGARQMAHGYPHFWTIRDAYPQATVTFEIAGPHASSFLQLATTNDLSSLAAGAEQPTFLLEKDGQVMSAGVLRRLEGEHTLYQLVVPGEKAARVAAWLRALSDSYVSFDDDPRARLPGPVIVRQAQANYTPKIPLPQWPAVSAKLKAVDLAKPYFIGQAGLGLAASQSGKAEWTWQPQAGDKQRTPLYEEHRKLGAKLIPFAGWDMPVWYTSVSEEHSAVRQAAGLFDVAHMGLFEIKGEHALSFLDAVASNDAGRLADGRACYAYLLDPDGNVIDDFFIYRLRADDILLVVNAANENKDWDWLNAVNDGRVVVDRQRPWVQASARAALRNLKNPAEGSGQKRDLALQGPNSLKILQALACTRGSDPDARQALGRMCRNDVIEVELAGIPLVAARTGYTGEPMGFELFLHPDHLVTLWRAILEAGAAFGVKPCGLAARDSTRTEAGLPLYGHELAGPYAISPAEAGFAPYVKYHKPFFIGRNALTGRDGERTRELVRWRMSQKGVRRPETGAPVVDRRGQVIGHVTSCSIDSEGFLLGLALVDRRHAEVGAPVGIFVLPAKPQPEKPKSELEPGDRVLVPVEAVILGRFPPKAKKAPAGNGGGA